MIQLKRFQLDISFCSAIKQKAKLKLWSLETGRGFLLLEIYGYGMAFVSNMEMSHQY
jgi:hypothetical protein